MPDEATIILAVALGNAALAACCLAFWCTRRRRHRTPPPPPPPPPAYHAAPADPALLCGEWRLLPPGRQPCPHGSDTAYGAAQPPAVLPLLRGAAMQRPEETQLRPAESGTLPWRGLFSGWFRVRAVEDTSLSAGHQSYLMLECGRHHELAQREQDLCSGVASHGADAAPLLAEEYSTWLRATLEGKGGRAAAVNRAPLGACLADGAHRAAGCSVEASLGEGCVLALRMYSASVVEVHFNFSSSPAALRAAIQAGVGTGSEREGDAPAGVDGGGGAATALRLFAVREGGVGGGVPPGGHTALAAPLLPAAGAEVVGWGDGGGDPDIEFLGWGLPPAGQPAAAGGG